MKTKYLIVILALISVQLFAADGDDSLHAIPAKEGMNITPRTPCWFSYTLTEPDKRLIISSVDYTEENTSLIVYDSCNGNIIAQNDDYSLSQSYVAISGLEPITIYIYWSDEHSSVYFNWRLSVVDDIELINCRNAVTAMEGSNNFTQANNWFYFTMPEINKKLVISTNSFTEEGGVYFYHNCDSDYFNWEPQCNGGLKKILYCLNSNETLYFHWSGNYFNNSNFELSVEDIEPGDIESLALTAVEGTNTFCRTPVWYSYTMPRKNQKLIIETPYSLDAPKKVFRSDHKEIIGSDCCKGLKFPSCMSYSDIDSSETVYINWTGSSCGQYSSPTFDLSIQDILPGNFCLIPINAVEGINYSKDYISWFSYTMSEADKKLMISWELTGFPYSEMYVFDSCNGHSIPLSWSGEKAYIADMEEGETIYLYFKHIPSWNLEIKDREPGDNCSYPLPIGEGTYALPGVPFWYKFTMPEKDKQLVISAPTVDYNYSRFSIINNCNDDGNSITLDASGVSRISGIDSGQTVIIRWDHTSIYDDFNWTLALGDYPVISTPEEIDITLDKGETGSCDVMIGNEGSSDLHVSITPESSAIMGKIIIPDTSLLCPENAITICLWLYLSSQYDSVDCDALDNWRIVLAKNLAFLGNGGYDIILEEDRTLTWDVGTVGGLMRYRSDEVLPYDKWTHLSFTYDAVNGKAAIYINGDKVGSSYLSEGNGKMLGNTTYLTLNNRTYNSCDNGYGHFPGNYDELSIWNKIRPLEDIRKDVNQPKIDFLEDGLIGYWGFENGKNPNGNSDGKVHDYSPNHIDGYGNCSLFDSPFSFFDISSQSLTVLPGTSECINLFFQPGERDTGLYEAKLMIRSDDPDENFKIIPVKMRIADVLTISGYVRTQEGVGIRGVILSGLPGNPATDSRGYFNIIINSGWNGTITPIHEMYNFDPPSFEISNINSDQVYEFIAILKTHTINGFIQTNEGHGVQGVLLFGLPGNPVTGSNGYYSATVNYGWNSKVIPTHSEYSFEPAYRDYINITADQNDNYVGTSYTMVPEHTDNPLKLSVYPNPFSDNTIFQYYLPEEAEVHLIVYDIRGMVLQTIANELQEEGNHTCIWDGSGAENGIYYYKLSVSSSVSNSSNGTIYGKLMRMKQ